MGKIKYQSMTNPRLPCYYLVFLYLFCLKSPWGHVSLVTPPQGNHQASGPQQADLNLEIYEIWYGNGSKLGYQMTHRNGYINSWKPSIWSINNFEPYPYIHSPNSLRYDVQDQCPRESIDLKKYSVVKYIEASYNLIQEPFRKFN